MVPVGNSPLDTKLVLSFLVILNPFVCMLFQVDLKEVKELNHLALAIEFCFRSAGNRHEVEFLTSFADESLVCHFAFFFHGLVEIFVELSAILENFTF